MPRPKKWRKVCGLPVSSQFGPLNVPLNKKCVVAMTVDEYETLRLIDLEGLTQEACAEHMSIARTTVQRIYNDARKKVADFLVNSRMLVIEGGDVKLCDGLEEFCDCGGCHRHRYGRDSTKKDHE